MNDQRSNKHFSAEVLADFFEGRLPEFKEAAVEAHVAQCPECSRAANRVRVFLRLWDGWNAKNHAAALQVSTVAKELAEAAGRESVGPLLRARLQEWSRRLADFQHKVQATLGGVESSLEQGFESTLDRLAEWGTFCLVSLQVDIPSVVPAGTRSKTTVFPAVEKGAGEKTGAIHPATYKLDQGVSLTISGKAGSPEGVTFVVDGLPQEYDPPFVLVIPVKKSPEGNPVAGSAPNRATTAKPESGPVSKAVPLRRDTHPGTGRAHLVATIRDLADGEYIFALEPLRHRLE